MSQEIFPWHLGVYDAHCHPTDTMASMDKIPGMRTRALTIMATRGQDQKLVADIAHRLASKNDALLNSDDHDHVVPAFGWHPWFSHQIYDDTRVDAESYDRCPSRLAHYQNVIKPDPEGDAHFLSSLPEPRSLSALLDQTRDHLERYPQALIGEIGLDRAFRIPGTEVLHEAAGVDTDMTPGGRDGRRLSPYRVDLAHQKKVLKAQLNLAGKLQRAVSVHGVAAHGAVFETLRETWHGQERSVVSKRARQRKTTQDCAQDMIHRDVTVTPDNDHCFPPRICLHSYSGSMDTVQQYLHPSVPAEIFFSFSELVNFSHASDKASAIIEALPNDRILAESDLHSAGPDMDDLMEKIIRRISHIKGWTLEHSVRQIGSNWKRFVFGIDENKEISCP